MCQNVTGGQVLTICASNTKYSLKYTEVNSKWLLNTNGYIVPDLRYLIKHRPYQDLEASLLCTLTGPNYPSIENRSATSLYLHQAYPTEMR